jgi:trigger factor
MDYTGIIDGKEHDNAKDTDATLMLGSGQFIDGFEEGLMGKTVGSTVQLDLKFSPYYSDIQVAGKSALFTVTVKSAQRPKIPEATVEVFGKIAGKTFADMEGVRQDIRSYLEGKKADSAYSALTTYLQTKLLDQGKAISYPEREQEIYRKQFIDYYTQGAESGITLEEYCRDTLQMTYEEFNDIAVRFAKESSAATMMILLIAQKENITCTDDQLRAIIGQLYANMSQYYADMDSFLTYYRQTYGADYFEDQVISAAVLEFLTKNAVKVS